MRLVAPELQIVSVHTNFMITLASSSATSTAPASAFFARCCEHSTWTEWSPDCVWVSLEGSPALGAKGILKPVGAPKVRFEITSFVEGREYTDTSRLPGARLTFQHLAETTPSGTELSVLVTMRRPLTFTWARIMGKGFKTSAPADLERLVSLVENPSP